MTDKALEELREKLNTVSIEVATEEIRKYDQILIGTRWYMVAGYRDKNTWGHIELYLVPYDVLDRLMRPIFMAIHADELIQIRRKV